MFKNFKFNFIRKETELGASKKKKEGEREGATWHATLQIAVTSRVTLCPTLIYISHLHEDTR